MAKRTGIIPRASAERILIKAGAKRVSADAVSAFSDIITDLANDVAVQAIRIAKHSGRKTVKEGDVKLAVKH
ncbi:NFYB/HAP3 family transcription factor subunit [Candidatus Woesearchaeota archaeon]|nr:NFYB/HAP3 family transcription factor subunit [Candidatus Woesearchaeota archaeon]